MTIYGDVKPEQVNRGLLAHTVDKIKMITARPDKDLLVQEERVISVHERNAKNLHAQLTEQKQGSGVGKALNNRGDL